MNLFSAQEAINHWQSAPINVKLTDPMEIYDTPMHTLVGKMFECWTGKRVYTVVGVRGFDTRKNKSSNHLQGEFYVEFVTPYRGLLAKTNICFTFLEKEIEPPFFSKISDSNAAKKKVISCVFRRFQYGGNPKNGLNITYHADFKKNFTPEEIVEFFQNTIFTDENDFCKDIDTY